MVVALDSLLWCCLPHLFWVVLRSPSPPFGWCFSLFPFVWCHVPLLLLLGGAAFFGVGGEGKEGGEGAEMRERSPPKRRK